MSIIIIAISFLLNIIMDLKLLTLKMNKWYIVNSILQLSFAVGLLFLFSFFNIYLSVFDKFLTIFSFMILWKFLWYFNKAKDSLKIRCLYKIAIFLIISVFVEIFVCNFSYFKTINYKPEKISLNDKVSTKIEKTKNEKGQNIIVEMLNINKRIKNVYVTVNYQYPYYAKIYATDKGNKLYLGLPTRQVYNSIEKSKYLQVHLSGKSEKIKIDFSFKEKSSATVSSIVINKPIPMIFSSVRCLIIFAIILFVYFLRSKSSLYKMKLVDLKHKKLLVTGLILINVCTFSVIGHKALLAYRNVGFPDCYNRLAESLIAGNVYVEDYNHSEEILKKISNPYDRNLRVQIFEDMDKTYLWDTAFYKGKYYVYFGVVPSLMFHVPYQLITHTYFSTEFACSLGIIITLILIILLLYQVVKKIFPKISTGVFILLSFLLSYCSGLMFLIMYPSQYSLPIITALIFIVLGLNLWLGTLKSNKLIKIKMFLGSLSLALVAGCRPQLLVSSLLLIPILLSFYKENKEKLRKIDYPKYAACIALPYIFVAGFLMYYNYIRFGSPFDFGANYNLTTNDMTVRGFDFARIPLGIVIYLFNPANFVNTFPYLQPTILSTNYLGCTIYEPTYGGLIFTTLIFGVSLFLPKFKKFINNKTLYVTSWMMLISAFVVIIFDTQAAGILPRYYCDFAWLFAFVTCIIVLALESSKIKYKDIFHKILFILICLALIYQIFYLFINAIAKNGPFYNGGLYLFGKYLFQFWI